MTWTAAQRKGMEAFVHELLADPPNVAFMLDYLCYELMALGCGEAHREAALELTDVASRLNMAYFAHGLNG